MKILRLLPALALVLLAAAPAWADVSTEEFVEKASIGNRFEILSSDLALKKSHNQAIRQFAHHMIADHTKVGAQLKSTMVSSDNDTSYIKETLDPAHQRKLDALKATSGKKFDAEYVADQREAHQEAVDLFRDYIKTGDDEALQRFARQTLPTLESHLQHVKRLKTSS